LEDDVSKILKYSRAFTEKREGEEGVLDSVYGSCAAGFALLNLPKGKV
jgi:hypothetical protein